MTETTPKSMRLQIGIFGRTNVGKSSFMNLIAGQDVAITSPQPGTTTDVVEKSMELLPLGPVVLLDTGGVDDSSVLGEERVRRSQLAMDRADVAVILSEPDAWSDHESGLAQAATARGVPCVAVVNKVDLADPSADFLARVRRDAGAVVCLSCTDGTAQDDTIEAFKQAVLDVLPMSFREPPTLVGDLVPAGGVVVLVVPIDLQAPKGRLILPQVHTIRDALDHDGAVLVVKEREYLYMLENLKQPPALVVCDSQVVQKMVADTPPGVPCTTFSILFARFKGDLNEEARGVSVIDNLHDGDRVLVAEACSHHALQDDIGRVKIPRWLRQYARHVRQRGCPARQTPDADNQRRSRAADGRYSGHPG